MIALRLVLGIAAAVAVGVGAKYFGAPSWVIYLVAVYVVASAVAGGIHDD